MNDDTVSVPCIVPLLAWNIFFGRCYQI